MDLQQLRNVVETAESGSISAAAKKLYMGQPNLSKSIKELENEIGILLFRRTAQGVSVTPRGKAFVAYAQSILAQMDKLESLYKPHAPATQLRASVPRATYVAAAFARYVGALGGTLHVQYHETNPLVVINDVATGQSSLGIVRFQEMHEDYFMRLLKENNLLCEPLWTYSMVALMSEYHPLAGMNDIPYHLLSRYPEVVHGDLLPVLPQEQPQAQPQTEKAGRLSVFDRASQFNILREVPGSYLWVSPLPCAELTREGMVQKQCASASRNKDILVWPAHLPCGETEKGLIAALKAEISTLITPV